jgi:hypothetical protein
MAGTDHRFLVVERIADLVLTATEDGGLERPLTGPTGGSRIVFRFVDGKVAGDGTVAVVEAAQLEPGTSFRARVVFPDAPPDEDFTDRRFELWLGHPVGSAVMVAIERDETPPSPDADQR